MAFRIEIAAGLGTGKSTLCRALENAGYNFIPEDLKQNPFLDDFYGDMQKFGFPFQLSFVSSKFRNIASANPDKINIYDYAVVNGRAYSTLAFAQNEPDALHVIMQGYDYLEEKLKPADIILFLDCPVDVQIKRIATRDRSTEADVPRDYLTAYDVTLRALLDAERAKGRKIINVQDNAVTGLGWDDHVVSVATKLNATISGATPKPQPTQAGPQP
jgi:deoxyadenosine/deoxycytidine kinase